MKCGVIDSENYFREAFKPIIEPLSTQKKQNEICNTHSTELENKSETSYTSEEEDDDNELNSQFENFLNNRPKSTRYDKSYDRMSTDMINFTSSPDPKKGSGLYKDVLPQTQLVYYDDPNELVTRLNLLVSSQSVGNTGVNKEIISILEELLNDKVRISKYKHIFSKEYTPNWTTEIFTVSKVLQINPVTYQLKDGSDNIILGGFYEQEIKLTNFPDTFLVERIIKKVWNKILVKWLGFDSSQNS
ncbi:hypothetical protein QTP88_029047 [Uroleucon formosanum]